MPGQLSIVDEIWLRFLVCPGGRREEGAPMAAARSHEWVSAKIARERVPGFQCNCQAGPPP